MGQSDTIHKVGNEGLEQEPDHLIKDPVTHLFLLSPKGAVGEKG